MCGIAGICSFNKISSQDSLLVKDFNSTMVRRGPDQEGLWSDDKNVVLGFRRLAIQDINPRASQPMFSEDGNYVLVYNGELYNTAPIRNELSVKYEFKTTSDTEVLLYALMEYGVSTVLNRIDGIFAFAFYDIKKCEIILARDRPGVKPLYYGLSHDRLVFSSQYDHIVRDPAFRNNPISTRALSHFIDLGYVPEGEGFFENTFLLPHGHYATYNQTGLTVTAYFEFPVEQSNGITDLETAIGQSVKSQLISDVPLGTFMSGGIDSTLVTYFAKNEVTNLKTFNIGSTDPEFDESKYAKAYSEIFKTDHFGRVFQEQDLQHLIKDNVAAYSEPFSDYSSLPTLLLSGFTKERVTVALSGDGGDELFWGYPRTLKSSRFTQERLKGKVGLLYSFLKNRTVGKKDLPLVLLQYKSFSAMYYSQLTVSGSQFWKPKILNDPQVADAYFLKGAQALESKLKDVEGLMHLMRKMEFDLHLQRILIKVDRASMFHSLEVRVPLLNNGMIQAATNYSFADCFHPGEGKIPLRKIIRKQVGDELAALPKKGFVVPIDEWIRTTMKKDFYEKVLDMPNALQVHFNRPQLEQLLKEHCEQRKNWSWIIWSLYSLSSWYGKHVER
ncbi:MAG TPA: asparagine synthase (glutamine-hydrolyzing) [Chryseolinea sp.]|nr:asparagine synthase (glutamine-hydrolyzing) [Chryseolinea sp.]